MQLFIPNSSFFILHFDFLSSAWTGAGPAGPALRRAEAAGTTVADFLELLLLLLREDFVKLAVNLLLQIIELCLLSGVEVQLVLEERRQDLAGLGRAAKTTWPARSTRPKTTRAARPAFALGPAWAALAAKAFFTLAAEALAARTLATRSALAELRVHFGRQRHKLLSGD